jgi:intracellular sulfur oxidation DsrE/DsrF family protein
MVLAPLVLSIAFAAAPVGQNLFIAGDGFTLEQAIADAQAQRTPLDRPNYKILVTGNEAQRLLAARATPDVVDLVRKAQASGGSVFVCGKDLKALGARPDDLLPGVVAVRGYIPYDSSRIEDWERKLPRAPDRKSMAVCAVD